MNPNPIAPPVTTTEPSVLDEILTRLPENRPGFPAAPGEAPVVGECLDARHPTLLGRYLVRYPEPDGRPVERWLASLYGLPVRAHDRVLLIQPGNWPEPLVVGVIDGFAIRPEPPAVAAASLELKPDEVVRVVGARGEPLVEVRRNEAGPVVRLLTGDVQLELPGKLALSAKSIDLRATLGGVNITATDDVIVRGESVHLN